MLVPLPPLPAALQFVEQQMFSSKTFSFCDSLYHSAVCTVKHTCVWLVYIHINISKNVWEVVCVCACVFNTCLRESVSNGYSLSPWIQFIVTMLIRVYMSVLL